MCNTCGYNICQCQPLVPVTTCDPCTQETGCKVKLPSECVTINNTTIKDFLQCTNLLNYLYNCIVADPVQYAKWCALWAACNGQQTCLAPANISIGAITTTSAVVSWQVLAGVTYEVFLDNVSIQTNATSPLTISGLTPNTQHTVRVVSTCSNGITNFAVVQFTTEQLGNLIFSWGKTAGESVDLSQSINGSFTSVNWGDGTVNTSLTHTYATSGDYTVSIAGATTTILFLTNLDFLAPNLKTIVAIPNTVTSLNISNNPLLTSIPSLANLTGLQSLLARDTGLSGTLTLTANTLLNTLRIEDNLFSGTLNLTTNTLLTYVHVGSNNLTSITGISTATNLAYIDAAYNNLPVSVINTILQELDANAITNGICTLNNQTPVATPTGLGLTSKTNLITDGWTVTTD